MGPWVHLHGHPAYLLFQRKPACHFDGLNPLLPLAPISAERLTGESTRGVDSWT